MVAVASFCVSSLHGFLVTHLPCQLFQHLSNEGPCEFPPIQLLGLSRVLLPQQDTDICALETDPEIRTQMQVVYWGSEPGSTFEGERVHESVIAMASWSFCLAGDPCGDM